MNTLPFQTSALSTHHGSAGTPNMRELSLSERGAVSGGMPAMILLGVGIAAFGIGVVADNYYDGPMAGWWYRVSN